MAKPSGPVMPTSLKEKFVANFWRQDHFAEYVHAERGLVDSHGLSDVNWAAVAFDVVTDTQLELLWPRLMDEPGFWLGGMPTQIVTKPFAYEPWEYHEPLPFPVMSPVHDIAAMGRVWYLEATACRRRHAYERLIESLRRVCRAAKMTDIGANATILNPMVPLRPPVRRNTASTRRFSSVWRSPTAISWVREPLSMATTSK